MRQKHPKFEDINDVEIWLESFSYSEFWQEIASFAVTLPRREDCDQMIAKGELSEELVLRVIKDMARVELAQRYDLDWADPVPNMALH